MESDSSKEGGENRLEEEKCENTMSIVCKIIRFRSLSSNSGNNSWENQWLDQWQMYEVFRSFNKVENEKHVDKTHYHEHRLVNVLHKYV